MITSMDWHSNERGDRLLTVSADRNGYVWTRLGRQTEWKPSLVLLRLRRAATCVRWSPDGLQFAVGGSEGIVSVGYYEAANDWWVCKHLRQHLDGSAILSVEWHRSSRFLAVSTLAGRVELLGASLHSSHESLSVGTITWITDPLMLCKNFDKTMASFEIGCWVHGMSFSPSGDCLALAAHDGNVHVIDFVAGGDRPDIISKPSKGLPIRRVLFVAERALLISGFGHASPILLTRESNGSWKSEGSLQSSSKSTQIGAATSSRGGQSAAGSSTNSSAATSKAFGGALAKFKAMDSHGIAIKKEPFESAVDKGAPSMVKLGMKRDLHQGTVSDIRLVVPGQISSTGHDGKLVIWNMSQLMARIGISIVSL